MKRLPVLLTLLLCFGICFSAMSDVFAQSKLDARQTVIEMRPFDYQARASIRLAPQKFFVIDFPPSDSTSFVTIQDDAALKMDDALKQAQNPKLPIVIRAGEGWNSSAAPTSLVVQMQSGAVLMLEISPAATAENSVDHLLWRYNMDAARVARETALSLPTAPDNKSTELGAPGGAVSPGNEAIMVVAAPAAPDAIAADALSSANTVSGGIFPQFQAADNADFILSSPSSRWVEAGKWTVTVVAVKNKSENALQLVNTPTLQIETTGTKKKESINNQTVTPLAVRTTAARAPIVLERGAVVYFSFVYETPVLGVNQRLLFAVAQTNAADRPAYLPIRPGASF